MDKKNENNFSEFDAVVTHECINDEQRAIILDLWREAQVQWWIYKDIQDRDKKRAVRDAYSEFIKAKRHLEWLYDYYNNVFLPNEKHIVKKLLDDLKQAKAMSSKFLNDFIKENEYKLSKPLFTENRKKIILRTFKKSFKELELAEFKMHNPLQ